MMKRTFTSSRFQCDFCKEYFIYGVEYEYDKSLELYHQTVPDTIINRCYHCHMQEITYYYVRLTRSIVEQIAKVSRKKHEFPVAYDNFITFNDICREYPNTCAAINV